MTNAVRRWRRAMTLATLALAPSWAPAAPMGPSTEALTTLPLEAGIDDDWAAKMMTLAIRQAVLRSDEYTTNDITKPFALLRLEAKCSVNDPKRPLNETSDLMVDQSCLQRIGKRLGVKSFLWGYVYHEGNARPRVKVHLWRGSDPDRGLALPFDTQSVERMAERFYRKLVIPERSTDVRLLSTKPIDGDLFVDGQPRGPYESELELTLLPGDHTVEVRREGKTVATTTARITPGPPRQLTLEPAEVSTAPFVPPPRPRPHVEVPPTTSGPTRATWGWVALGVGAASLGAGVFSSLRVKALSDDFESDAPSLAYRRGAGAGDACDAAEAGTVVSLPGAASPGQVGKRCDTIATFQTLQYVFYGVGALTAGAGAYLLLTSPSASKATAAQSQGQSWRWRPEVGARHGGLFVEGRF